MLQSDNLTFISDFSHPFFNSLEPKQLKDLLLELAKKHKSFSSILRGAANEIRNRTEGYNRTVTRNKILKLLKEFECCEIVDLVDETGINEKEIKAALAELWRIHAGLSAEVIRLDFNEAEGHRVAGREASV